VIDTSLQSGGIFIMDDMAFHLEQAGQLFADCEILSESSLKSLQVQNS
jgi:hypothetical protein